jgi:hypothetical protein
MMLGFTAFSANLPASIPRLATGALLGNLGSAQNKLSFIYSHKE